MKKRRVKIGHLIGDLLINGIGTLMIIPFRFISPKAIISLSKFIGTALFGLNKKYRERVTQKSHSCPWKREKFRRDYQACQRSLF